MTEDCQHTNDKEWKREYYKKIEELSGKYDFKFEVLTDRRIGVIGDFTYSEETYLEIEEIAIGMCEFLRDDGDEVDYSILDSGFDIVIFII